MNAQNIYVYPSPHRGFVLLSCVAEVYVLDTVRGEVVGGTRPLRMPDVPPRVEIRMRDGAVRTLEFSSYGEASVRAEELMSQLRGSSGDEDEGGVEEAWAEPITDYWLEHYCSDHCTLCGNSGVIDSRGTTTAGGVHVGRLNWCICPNGQAKRRAGLDLSRWPIAREGAEGGAE